MTRGRPQYPDMKSPILLALTARGYTLVEHIGKGTTFDARYTIRIAFDWDRDRRQVIVGYIGRHQQTDAS